MNVEGASSAVGRLLILAGPRWRSLPRWHLSHGWSNEARVRALEVCMACRPCCENLQRPSRQGQGGRADQERRVSSTIDGSTSLGPRLRCLIGEGEEVKGPGLGGSRSGPRGLLVL